MRAQNFWNAAVAPVAIAIGIAGGAGCGGPAGTAGNGGSNGGSADAGASCPIAIAGGAACLCPSAANLLPEPGFDTDVSAWEQNGGADWSSTDATSCTRSGSLEVMVDPLGGSQSVMNAQCVPVTAGQTYDFGARVLLPMSDPSTGASIGVEWIEFADCHGSFTMTAGPTADTSRAGSWQSLSGSAVAPATAAAAYLTLQVTAPQGTSSSALFDDVSLSAYPATF
jgi:hypothetical protein